MEEYGVLGMLVGAGRSEDGKARFGLFPFMANVADFHNLPSAPHFRFLVIVEGHEAAQISPNTKGQLSERIFLRLPTDSSIQVFSLEPAQISLFSQPSWQISYLRTRKVSRHHHTDLNLVAHRMTCDRRRHRGFQARRIG